MDDFHGARAGSVSSISAALGSVRRSSRGSARAASYTPARRFQLAAERSEPSKLHTSAAEQRVDVARERLADRDATVGPGAHASQAAVGARDQEVQRVLALVARE